MRSNKPSRIFVPLAMAFGLAGCTEYAFVEIKEKPQKILYEETGGGLVTTSVSLYEFANDGYRVQHVSNNIAMNMTTGAPTGQSVITQAWDFVAKDTDEYQEKLSTACGNAVELEQQSVSSDDKEQVEHQKRAKAFHLAHCR